MPCEPAGAAAAQHPAAAPVSGTACAAALGCPANAHTVCVEYSQAWLTARPHLSHHLLPPPPTPRSEDDETVMASFSKLRDNRPDAFHSSRNGGKAGMQAALRDSAATGITFGWVPRAAGQSGATLDPTSLQWIAVKPAPPKPSKSRGI